MAADNKTIGRFHLDGIPPAQEARLKSKYIDIDANGIIKVSAQDKAIANNKILGLTHFRIN